MLGVKTAEYKGQKIAVIDIFFTSVRRIESIIVVSKRSRGRPRRIWVEQIKGDLHELQVSVDLIRVFDASYSYLKLLRLFPYLLTSLFRTFYTSLFDSFYIVLTFILFKCLVFTCLVFFYVYLFVNYCYIGHTYDAGWRLKAGKDSSEDQF